MGVQDVGEIAKVALPKGKGGTAYLAFNTPEVRHSLSHTLTFCSPILTLWSPLLVRGVLTHVVVL